MLSNFVTSNNLSKAWHGFQVNPNSSYLHVLVKLPGKIAQHYRQARILRTDFQDCQKEKNFQASISIHGFLLHSSLWTFTGSKISSHLDHSFPATLLAERPGLASLTPWLAGFKKQLSAFYIYTDTGKIIGEHISYFRNEVHWSQIL